MKKSECAGCAYDTKKERYSCKLLKERIENCPFYTTKEEQKEIEMAIIKYGGKPGKKER